MKRKLSRKSCVYHFFICTTTPMASIIEKNYSQITKSYQIETESLEVEEEYIFCST